MKDEKEFNRKVFYTWGERLWDQWWMPLVVTFLILLLIGLFP